MAEFSFLEDDNNPKAEDVFEDDVVAKYLKVLEDQGVIVHKEQAKMMEPTPIEPAKKIGDVNYPSLTIQMAINDSDFIINLWPRNPTPHATQQIKAKQNNIIMQFIGVLQKYIPDYLQVKIMPPAKEYDVAAFTLRVVGATDALGFDIDVLAAQLPEELYHAWSRGSK